MATWSHHVILLVIIQQHSIKIYIHLPLYLYLLLNIPNLIFLSQNIALIKSRPLVLPVVISLQFQSDQHLFGRSHPFHIRYHTRIGLPYKALQFKKAHKTESTKDGVCLEDVTPLYKHHDLEISVSRPRYTGRWTQRSMSFWYLFDSSTRKTGCIDILLGHFSSEATNERPSKEEALLNCWERSWSEALEMYTTSRFWWNLVA